MGSELPEDLSLDRPQELLRDRVLARIRQAIVAGRYRPGQRLLEKELCDALDVSRTSVREALRQLEIEGLVEVGPRGRPFVAEMTAVKARQIYEFREVLECAAGRLFVARAPESACAELQALAARFRAALDTGDLVERLAVKQAFYDVLFTHAGNPAIHSVFDQLFHRIGFLRSRSLGQQVRAEARAAELDQIVACLVARDAEGAANALGKHIRMVSAAAVTWLESREAGEESWDA
ncbi:GntR family transcriptional regulator [Oceanicola sp. 502str15]|uniref:GntR family transcriptional regulator n=1 Tax=Oceanicola sp. 502str15 TaxID=2696061 RepID=UPI0020946049|nr:GntR family transcriptional regulator [Oceanicola sp. 502str15]MCO6381517.1 FCD domain-containing protein [Oceanicola sp. 502str15]